MISERDTSKRGSRIPKGRLAANSARRANAQGSRGSGPDPSDPGRPTFAGSWSSALLCAVDGTRSTRRERCACAAEAPSSSRGDPEHVAPHAPRYTSTRCYVCAEPQSSALSAPAQNNDRSPSRVNEHSARTSVAQGKDMHPQLRSALASSNRKSSKRGARAPASERHLSS